MKTDNLKQTANLIRQEVIKMLEIAGSGHAAGALGLADVFTALYFRVLRHRPRQPRWSERDRLIVSNGHICPVWYATLAYAGYFHPKKLATLRQLGSSLQGHPHLGELPGIETSSGPLGQGISMAIGLALAGQLDAARWRVYCLVSDGELNEGQSWEALMCGSKYRLHNLTVLLDRNNIQIGGYTEDVMPLEPLRDKLQAFGWQVLEVDGHNIDHIVAACDQAKVVYERPTIIICHTIPGKGVGFMQYQFKWHGRPPTHQEAKEALRELRSLGGKIDYL